MVGARSVTRGAGGACSLEASSVTHLESEAVASPVKGFSRRMRDGDSSRPENTSKYFYILVYFCIYAYCVQNFEIAHTLHNL